MEMKTYSTYQEAKIVNPDSDIWTDGLLFYASNESTQGAAMDKCHPSGYCISLNRFLANGYRLVNGDAFLNTASDANLGELVIVGAKYVSEKEANKPSYVDDMCYILRAKTLEQAEIDTTPNQVESLVGGVEWDGEGLPPIGVECNFTPDNTVWGFNYIESFTGCVLHYEGEQFVFMLKHEKYKLKGDMVVVSRTDKGEFSKPETPQQKAEREKRDEAKEMIQCILDNYDEFDESATDYVIDYLKECFHLGK